VSSFPYGAGFVVFTLSLVAWLLSCRCLHCAPSLSFLVEPGPQSAG
jgi:hypothetical protein